MVIFRSEERLTLKAAGYWTDLVYVHMQYATKHPVYGVALHSMCRRSHKTPQYRCEAFFFSSCDQ